MKTAISLPMNEVQAICRRYDVVENHIPPLIEALEKIVPPEED